MTTTHNSRSIGRDQSCDLVLKQPGVSRFHASLELASDGQLSVQDNNSGNGTFLHRGEQWIQIKRIILCIGDRVRFGECEVALQQLTAVFGQHSNARLEARHFALKQRHKQNRVNTDSAGPTGLLNKPVRNPLTGKIEERE